MTEQARVQRPWSSLLTLRLVGSPDRPTTRSHYAGDRARAAVLPGYLHWRLAIPFLRGLQLYVGQTRWVM